MIRGDVSLRALAYNCFCNVARSSRMTTAELFRSHKKFLFGVLVRWMPHRPGVLDEVCEALLDVDAVSLLKEALPIVLPDLILEGTPLSPSKSSSLPTSASPGNNGCLEHIAERTGASVRNIISDRLGDIIAHILMHKNLESDQVSDSVTFLVKSVWYTDTSFSDLLKTSKSSLLERLVDALGLIGERQHVMHALWVLVLSDDNELEDDISIQANVTPDPIRISHMIAEYYLMLADGLCRTIRDRSLPSARRLQAVRSLAGLIDLCAPSMTSFGMSLAMNVYILLISLLLF